MVSSKLLIAALTVIFGYSVTNSDIILYPQEILIPMNSHERVVIEVKNFTKNNVTLNFVIENNDVIEVLPSKILLISENQRQELILNALNAGHSKMFAQSSDPDVSVSHLNLVANIFKNEALDVVSHIFGWIFFIAWALSYYPQIYINFKRKSVVGLSFDYLAISIVGYISFGVFIHSLYFSSAIQEEYFESSHGLIPVKLNDVFYNIHGFCALCFTIFQCFIYERENQVLSTTTKIILALLGLFYIVLLVLRAISVIQWLDLLYYCSYVKLAIIVFKSVPQAYMNYKRKSTAGWSIGLVILNLLGGFCSMTQMIVDSYNYNGWASIFGNPAKFGLGLLGMVFPVLFILQHYMFYRNNSVITKF